MDPSRFRVSSALEGYAWDVGMRPGDHLVRACVYVCVSVYLFVFVFVCVCVHVCCLGYWYAWMEVTLDYYCKIVLGWGLPVFPLLW